jgi:Protein of unknown function (DUF2642)
MSNLATKLISIINQDVILTTSLNDQLHGQIVGIDGDCISFQMTNQKKFINIAHVVYVIPKNTIKQ